MNVLSVIPIVLLTTAAVAILILQWLRPGFGLAWLIAGLGAFLAWIAMLFLRLRLPLSLSFELKSTDLFSFAPALLLDRISWPYALGLITLVFAAILTASARRRFPADPFNWAGSLAISALGLLAILSGNPLTLMMAWVAFDLVELIILQGGRPDQNTSQRIVVAFSARTIGVLVFFLAVVFSGTDPNTFALKHISIQSGLLIFIGCGLRLGVLPLHLPFSQEPRLRRELGTILRLVPVVSTLVLLARLPAAIIPEAWVPWLLSLVALAALYAGGMWLAADNELNGRPYWMLGWAALAFACVIRGSPLASVAWGIVLLLQGGFLFLYSAREKYLVFLPVLGVWGIMGLPFSPAASGWPGLFEPTFNLFSIAVYISQGLLLAGFIRHVARPGFHLASADRWAQAVYPVGLLSLMVADLILGVWGWPGSLTRAYAWAGIPALVGCALFLGLSWRHALPILTADQVTDRPAWQIARPFFSRLSVIFRLEWFYNLVGLLYRSLGRLLGGVTAVLEGDGGVLWILLLLSLVITLFGVGGL